MAYINRETTEKIRKALEYIRSLSSIDERTIAAQEDEIEALREALTALKAENERLAAEVEVWKASFEQAASGHATYAERTEQLQAENGRLQADVDALRLNAAFVQPDLVAAALAACDAMDDLVEKWFATRESRCLPLEVVRASGASKLLRALLALEGTK